MERQEVYKLIDTERDYQNSVWGEAHDAGHSVGEFLCLLKVYVDKSMVAWTSNSGDLAALDVVRKISGLSVACMEVHDAPRREL